MDAIEGVAPGFIRLQRNSPAGSLDVGYELDFGVTTATSGVDYAPLSGVASFADGSETTDILIDPTGPYSDEVEEPREVVGIQLVWAGQPGGGQPPLPQPVLAQAGIVNKPIGNQPPNFVGDPYTFRIGYGAEAGRRVGQVTATDPDNDVLKYSITAGNTGGMFEINASSGEITVAKEKRIALDAVVWDLRVKVDDGRGGSDAADVTIWPTPLVAVTGDAHATEGATDTLTVRFVRIAPQHLLWEQEIAFDVNWQSALPGDFDAAELAKLLPGGVARATFPAGATSIDIIMAAKVDPPDGKESFKVTVLDSPTGAYIGVDNGVGFQDTPAKKVFNFNGFRDYTYWILDETALFGRNYAGPPAGADPHVVDANDLQQGDIGSCWLNAAVDTLARRNPSFIVGMFSDETATTVKVRFYRRVDGPEVFVTVDKTLNFGTNMSVPKWDTDDQGRYEIWPQVLETAYAKFRGDGDIAAGRQLINAGGACGTAMVHLTGRAVSLTDTSTLTANDLETLVRNALNQNPPQSVTLGTYGSNRGQPGWNLPIVPGHAYTAVRLDGNNVVLRDPRAAEVPGINSHISVPLADLKTYFAWVYIQ